MKCIIFLSLKMDQESGVITFSHYNDNGHTFNGGLILDAQTFRQDIDYVNFGTIQVFDIVGANKNTVGEVDYDSRTGRPDPKYTLLGDGTVPLVSSTSINHTTYKPYYVASGVDHKELCSDVVVRSKILEILSAPASIIQETQIAQADTLPAFFANNYTIKVDHEVALHVYDSLSNHTGSISDTTWEANIPGSEYIPGDLHQANSLKVVILPREKNYRFIIESQDTTSHFELVLDDIVNGNQVASLAYDSIATLPNTVARSAFQSITPELNLVVDRKGDSTELIVTKPNTIQISTTALRRWNLISIPVVAFDSSRVILFPSAISNAFSYNPGLGYQTEDAMHIRRGYWLKFDSTEMIPFRGIPRWIDTINVQQGWNLIGSISSPVPVSTITSIPGGIITGNFCGYSSGYHTTDTIFPGKGYWAKVSQAGSLILSSTPQINPANRIKIVATTELPPAPPNGESPGNKQLPRAYSLEQNYSNPFNPMTRIKYQLPVDSRVTVKVYNVLGQVVEVLKDGVESAGYKSTTWNATNFASGVYFYRLEAVSTADPRRTYTQVRKMVLMK